VLKTVSASRLTVCPPHGGRFGLARPTRRGGCALRFPYVHLVVREQTSSRRVWSVSVTPGCAEKSGSAARRPASAPIGRAIRRAAMQVDERRRKWGNRRAHAAVIIGHVLGASASGEARSVAGAGAGAVRRGRERGARMKPLRCLAVNARGLWFCAAQGDDSSGRRGPWVVSAPTRLMRSQHGWCHISSFNQQKHPFLLLNKYISFTPADRNPPGRVDGVGRY